MGLGLVDPTRSTLCGCSNGPGLTLPHARAFQDSPWFSPTFFVSFAVGALLGDAFIHLIPETFAGPVPNSAALGPSLLVLGGMMAFFVVEKLLLHRHGILHEHYHPAVKRPELATINIPGDAIHNFIDGL